MKLRNMLRELSTAYYLPCITQFYPVWRLECFQRRPARSRRRWKGNPVPGSITESPCQWGTYMQGDLDLQVGDRMQGSVKNIIIAKSK
jgi:hypothetical protein